MKVRFKREEKLESKVLLDEFEELIQWKLPKDFRRFVKRYNGAKVGGAMDWVIPCDVRGGLSIECFMNFNRSSDLNIWEWQFIDDDYEWFEEENLAEKYGELSDYFAFAYTPFGCKICFNKKDGGVYYFDTDDCSLTKIADNFKGFIKSIHAESWDDE